MYGFSFLARTSEAWRSFKDTVGRALYFKYVVLLLFFHNSNGQQNSPSVNFGWENI